MNNPQSIREGIRAAALADIPALLALEAEFPTDRLTRAHWRHLLTRGHSLALVYEQGGEVMGDVVVFFRKTSRVARVYSLIVHPRLRGQGVGGKLMSEVHQSVRGRGVQAVALEVRVDNTAAQALYARLGYRLERRLHGFYEDGSDALRLVKPLAAAVGEGRGLHAAVGEF